MPVFVTKESSYNPRAVHCPLCLVSNPDMMLMMGSEHKYICSGCKFMHLGRPDSGACVKCGCSILVDDGEPNEDESFPNVRPCGDCAKKIKTIDAIVHLGGVSFRCVSCGSMGAFAKDDSRAVDFRAKNPGKVSCEIDKTTCPQCIEKTKNESI